MAFGGIGGVIAQYPDADTAELRAALLETTRAAAHPQATTAGRSRAGLAIRH